MSRCHHNCLFIVRLWLIFFLPAFFTRLYNCTFPHNEQGVGYRKGRRKQERCSQQGSSQAILPTSCSLDDIAGGGEEYKAEHPYHSPELKCLCAETEAKYTLVLITVLSQDAGCFLGAALSAEGCPLRGVDFPAAQDNFITKDNICSSA